MGFWKREETKICVNFFPCFTKTNVKSLDEADMPVSTVKGFMYSTTRNIIL